jgi:NAD(P)-dependent dehydrogenase (short-subunit alcohol dehydrogenase family)
VSLKNHHAIVTGGATGIGLAITRILADAGTHVTIASRDLEQSRLVAASMQNVKAVALDITNPDAITKVFADIEPIDILVNNAGTASTAPFHRITLDDWNAMLSINLTGTFLCSQAALASMRRRSGVRATGRIINIASTAGLKGSSYTAAYTAAKHGVVGMTRSLAMELASTDITANCICPGFTNTDIVTNAIANISDKTGLSKVEALAELIKDNPQKRLIEPEEVAAAVLWLCQETSKSINGQSIVIAGGEIM